MTDVVNQSLWPGGARLRLKLGQKSLAIGLRQTGVGIVMMHLKVAIRANPGRIIPPRWRKWNSLEPNLFQPLTICRRKRDYQLTSASRGPASLGLMKNVFKKFIADESGATAIEYGLIAAGISLAIITMVNGLGTNLKGKFTSINTSLK